MPFDIRTAKPLEREERGFDIRTAKSLEPPKESGYFSELIKNIPADIKGLLVGMTPVGGYQLGQTIAGTIIHPKEALKSISEVLKLAKKEPWETTKAILPAMAEQLKEQPISTALLATPFGKIGISKLVKLGKVGQMTKIIPKIAEAGKIQPMIEVAEALPTALEKGSVQNIAKRQFVRDNLNNFTGKQAELHIFNAAKMTEQVKPAIREAQNKFYTNLGIKDTDLINSSEVLTTIKEEISKAPKYIDIKEINKVKAIYSDLLNNSKKIKGEMQTPFGHLKESTRILYDLAEDHINALGRKTTTGKFYSKLGKALTDAKKTDFRIVQASGQYTDLLNAEHLINKTMRIGSELGEMRLESKIASSFKDKTFGQFKDNLNKVEEILKKYPETEHLVGYGGFTDRIGLAQLANDIATKKAILPIGAGRLPVAKKISQFLKIGDPGFQAQLLKKVPSERILRDIPISQRLYGGTILTKIRALSELFKK